jgi:hypothetical protein
VLQLAGVPFPRRGRRVAAATTAPLLREDQRTMDDSVLVGMIAAIAVIVMIAFGAFRKRD